MTDEARNLHRRIMLALGQGDARLFRNNTGVAWQGAPHRQSDGSLLLTDPRPLHAGLCVGSSDLIGWRSITILPEHVGRKIAAFVAIEAKTGRGRLTDAQQAFINAVRAGGGIAGEARSVEDAARLLKG
jgi:hypothetical protein